MADSKLLASKESIHSDLARIAQDIVGDLPRPDDALIVGVHGKGVWIAEYLKRLLETHWNREIPAGTLDVGMYRDDLDERPIPEIQPTDLPTDIKGRTIILVDDVIFSGRTIRAALDSLHDFGRPDRILLVVLVDRGERRLPIMPNYTGRQVTLKPEQHVQVTALANNGGFEVYINSA